MVRISNSGISRLFLGAIGYYFNAAVSEKNQISLKGFKQKIIHYSDLLQTPAFCTNLWLSGVSFSLKDGSNIKLLGITKGEANSFISDTEKLLGDYLYDALKLNEENVRLTKRVLERLSDPTRYPSACLLAPYLKTAQQLVRKVPTVIPPALMKDDDFKQLEEIIKFVEKPGFERDQAIKNFFNNELPEMKEFFDKIEKHPLTPEQRLAILTDEDATLVMAGAGSGKTSVIVSKSAYLIKKGIRTPNEILLLAFGKDAASEMEERIKELVGVSIKATTFHALGYEIIAEVEGTAPPLAKHAGDDAKLRELLREILNDLSKDKDLGALILKWFSELYWPYKSEWDFDTKDEYYRYVEAHELRSLKGDLVRSFEELEIANWLFLNDIKYEYEPLYEHKLPDTKHKAYTPDFKLTDSGVYIEHFGVRKNTFSNGEFELYTSPNINRLEYLEGMEWKRKVHASNKTILIETFSYERDKGILISTLEEKLKPYAQPKPIPIESAFEIINELGQVDSFTQTLATFLKHFKNCNSSIEECRARAENNSDTRRSYAFLDIFKHVYEAYEDSLGEWIDFEDMIGRAAKHLETGRYKSPFKHILIDEFQDISEGRARLVKALKAQHSDARVFAVGDDWQSIYRFTGADIHLMRDFGKIFGGEFDNAHDVHNVVDLGRTFRSVDKIAIPARKFVLKNPIQIEKEVLTLRSTEQASIHISYFTRGTKEKALVEILNKIAINSPKGTSVLVLGRYRHVKPRNWTKLCSEFSSLEIIFKTVHASKGLEADHVIVLDLKSDAIGFPSEIVDDPVLNLVLPEAEEFPHAEERRLFYVALTRAKNSVYLLADQENPSVFVRELSNTEYEIDETKPEEISKHLCSKCGGRMLSRTSKTRVTFFACEHRRLCGETAKACTLCESDLPINVGDELRCSCGASYPVCPLCNNGWLVERKGRFGKFLGCVKYPVCHGKK